MKRQRGNLKERPSRRERGNYSSTFLRLTPQQVAVNERGIALAREAIGRALAPQKGQV